MYREKYKEYIQLIDERLSPKRFLHSLNVAKEAVGLAPRVGADPEKAYVAGLLHDVTKEENTEMQLQTLKQSGIINDDIVLGARPLMHSKTGMLYCRDILHISDQDILNAVSYHTTGRADMSPLEIAVFLADYIGEDRDYEDVDVMREQTAHSIQKGMVYALTYSIIDLASRKKTIHPDTLAAYNQWVVKEGK